MASKKTAPTTLVKSAGAKYLIHYKGTKISLSPLQFSIFSTLSNGGRHSSHRLMQRCKTSDPRKEVQYLRRKGINVRDVWVEATPTIPRHKRYWIEETE